MRGSRDETVVDALDVRLLAAQAHLTLDTFEPDRLRGVGDQHPHTAALAWYGAIRDLDRAPARTGPPTALYFLGPPGRGKTHLAVALALLAHASDRAVTIINEVHYLQQIWALPFEAAARRTATTSTAPWLLVVDDIGKRQSSNGGASIQNAWYALLDPRYVARRFTIFTSEYPLTELVTRGTINESLAGRITEMTHDTTIMFAGPDSRQGGVA